MTTRDILLACALKFEGDWNRIFHLISNREVINETEMENLIKANKLKFVTILDDEYPEDLKHAEKPPFVLFYKGDISLLKKEKKLAVIGTRKPSFYGTYVTKKLVEGLDKDIVIVSGAAAGIDSTAHEAALKNGLKTIAVIGCGINNVFPSDNAPLYKEIELKGLIVSEYPDFVSPDSSHFPVRNRIIAGLSSSILVTEAFARSGTSITVNFGLRNGKTILSVPTRISDENESFCNDLIREGAVLIRSSEDILEEF